MQNNQAIVLLLAGLAFAGGVEAKQVSLQMKYEPVSKTIIDKLLAQGTPDKAQCSFQVQSAEDLRQNKITIGFNGDNLLAQNVDVWLQNAASAYLDPLKSEQAASQITVHPKLTRLYTYNESMNILGVSSVIFDFKVNGQIVATRQYRGFYAKMNFAGADGEYVTTLNDSINNLMPKVLVDAKNVCKSIVK